MSSHLYADESRLVQDCSTGCSGPWAEFIGRYGRLIESVCRRVRYRRSAWQCEPEDMAGYVYEKLLEDNCRRLRAWRQKSKFSTYLLQVASNLCIDYVMQNNRGYRVASSDDIPDVAAPDNAGKDDEIRARRKTVEIAMKRLSPKQALILRMRLEGRSLREIAKILNMPSGTVAAENSRAMERLRAIIAAGDEGGNNDALS